MGNSGSNEDTISEEAVDEYAELTYLSRREIRQIYKLVDELEPSTLRQNHLHRFPTEQIDKILPQIRCNPFRDAIYKVFSSERDGRLSFEDILDLCSAFSANCPQEVRMAWAFEIFDFDGDDQLSLNDLLETVQRLTGTDERGQFRIDSQRGKDVARMILQEMNLSGTGSVSPQEFVHMLSRMPDFAHTFQFRV
ncbi:hypothetical protein HN011_000481 [Eciton burchellii]|nr:hypothetical protein HN011_000481 [Eciton burchellii]